MRALGGLAIETWGGDGGSGGAGADPDGAAGEVNDDSGGGGGAAGRIRVNTPDAASLLGILSPSLASGAATVGPFEEATP